MSAEVDRLVMLKLNDEGIRANKAISDEVFVRRIYLDLVGRIPTFAELSSFLQSKKKDKRPKLIDLLAESEGYVSHNFNYWADVLRSTSRMRNATGSNYISYIKDSLRKNKPYDKFVHELLTSNGKIYEEGNGASGYYVRDAGMPLDNMANTMQVFLGTSIVCAQCHDHPFDRWTQMDFYQLAAFTSGVRVARYGSAKKDPRMTFYKKIDKTDREFRRIVQRLAEVAMGDVSHSGTGLIRLPHDYSYDDGKPHALVKAGVPYGEDVKIDNPRYKKELTRKLKAGKTKHGVPGEDINSRKTFADWATSKENPMFTKTIVNRLWAKYMGAPLIGPLLNITKKADGANKALTEKLVEIMKSLNYDLKAFTKVIVNSKSYQREAMQEDLSADNRNYFPGPALRRLTAEQLWDSLLSLGVEKPDMKLPHMPVKDTNEIMFAKLNKLDVDEFQTLALKIKDEGKSFLKQYIKDEQMANMSMASMTMNTEMASTQETYKVDKKRYNAIRGELKKASKKSDKRKIAQLKEELNLINSSMKQASLQQKALRNAKRKDFTRASEIQSPAPASHFLRRFGQSERLLIDGAVDEASVPQALTLLNGKVEDYITNNSISYINMNLQNAKNNRDKISVAFRSILSREASVEETNMFAARFEEDPEQTRKDLIWVLINSNEFRFVK
jgi:hypothetical protein